MSNILKIQSMLLVADGKSTNPNRPLFKGEHDFPRRSRNAVQLHEDVILRAQDSLMEIPVTSVTVAHASAREIVASEWSNGYGETSLCSLTRIHMRLPVSILASR